MKFLTTFAPKICWYDRLATLLMAIIALKYTYVFHVYIDDISSLRQFLNFS